MGMSKAWSKNILQALFSQVDDGKVNRLATLGLCTKEPAYVHQNAVWEGNTLITPEATVLVSYEVNKQGYSRVALGSTEGVPDSRMMAPPDEETKSITNQYPIALGEAEENWGTITHFAIFDGKTGGEPVLWGPLTEPVTVPEGYVPIFKKGTLTVSIE